MAMPNDVSQLQKRARAAMEEGRIEEAIKGFLNLERIDPNPEWSRTVAELFYRNGCVKDAISALDRAADEHAKRNEILKAVAVCKQLLALEPRHTPTLNRLGKLRNAWDSSRPNQTARTRTPPARAQSWAAKPAAGIEQLPLREVVDGATQNATRGVYEIPLENDVLDAPLELATRPARSPSSVDEPIILDALGNVRAAAPAPKSDGTTVAIPQRDADDPFLAVEQEMQQAGHADRALMKSPLFSNLSEKSFNALILHSRLVDLTEDQLLFRQGDKGDALYVIASGEVGVIDEGPPRRGIARLKDGDVFGELALITDEPRTASIVALTKTELIAIDRATIQKVVASDAEFLKELLRFFRDRMVDRLLSTNPLFNCLSERDWEMLKKRFRFLEIEADSILIEEGQRPEGLLIVLTGRVDVLRTQEGREIKLGQLKAGDVCGEMSLLTKNPSLARVRAASKCLAIELPAAAFEKIIHARPEAMAFIKKVAAERAAQGKAILAGRASYAEGHVSGV